MKLVSVDYSPLGASLMKSPRLLAVRWISLCLLMLCGTVAVSNMRWPEKRETRIARAVGRYHAYKKTDQFFQRAAAGGAPTKTTR